MKKSLLFLSLLLAAASAFAQAKHGLQLAYTRNLLDKNLVLSAHRTQGQHDFSLGIAYHLWWRPNTDGSLYVQTGHASSLANHFGLDAGYQIHFLQKEGECRAFSPFAFFNLQVMHLGLRLPQYPDYLSFGTTHVIDPFWSFSNNLGFGLNTQLGKGLSLTHQLGAGICLYEKSPYIISGGLPGNLLDYEFIAPFYRVGLRWDIPRKLN